ncbi:DUF4105 domain-containing protein [Marinicella litoralis]|uniref:Uncharacterized protein DUF4105 n=1 Tax=Marinicella litoralis TaxID=644220 RepID=A0A4R6XKG2_9GAMM|nr:DUF4105 domain-containing protein [Marinicella litoralis]TDR18384.1 uncharacterized protein DUF4105 [Marinicella litoralis]
MSQIKLLVFLLLAHLSVQVQADKEIKLITIGAGSEFWSAFGHTALAIDDDVYGFGYFSFEDEDLIQSFLSNQMQYDLGVSDFSREIELARWQNRTFIVQHLKLSDAEISYITEYLFWHNLPENQSYHYDYFLNNCSSKIRDILDQAWGGLLRNQFNQASNSNYFKQTFPAKNQSLMNLGMAMAYGWSAYSTRSEWELMALPQYLQSKISELGPLKVSSSTVLYHEVPQNRVVAVLKTHGVLLGLFTSLFLLLLFNKTKRATQKAVWIVQSLIGLVLLGLWVFSGHQTVGLNFNVLLFFPFAFLITKYRYLRGLLMASYAIWLVLALILGAWYLLPILLIHWMALNFNRV